MASTAVICTETVIVTTWAKGACRAADVTARGNIGTGFRGWDGFCADGGSKVGQAFLPAGFAPGRAGMSAPPFLAWKRQLWSGHRRHITHKNKNPILAFGGSCAHPRFGASIRTRPQRSRQALSYAQGAVLVLRSREDAIPPFVPPPRKGISRTMDEDDGRGRLCAPKRGCACGNPYRKKQLVPNAFTSRIWPLPTLMP